MSKYYAKGPYNFGGCHICTVSRAAESRGASLTEKELTNAFAVQAAQSKTAYTPKAKNVTKAAKK